MIQTEKKTFTYVCRVIFLIEYFSGKSQVRFPRVQFLGWDAIS